jgi:hypothetical protein
MPSHLSSIGFQVETQDDLVQLAEEAATDATEIAVEGGSYVYWAGAGGEELWLQVNSQQALVGMNPHFSGQSRVRVALAARVARDSDTALDGALHVWATPVGDSHEYGAYPFVFDLPDAAVYADLEIPGIAEAQVAAFAHEITFFESEDAYNSSQESENVPFASKSFIPSGMFHPSGENNAPPEARAIFTGEVVQAATCTNQISQQKFYWALVDTIGGQYDVVIDPVLLDREPAVGGFLSGTFWLSGRLTSYPRKKRSWFGKLLGGGG